MEKVAEQSDSMQFVPQDVQTLERLVTNISLKVMAINFNNSSEWREMIWVIPISSLDTVNRFGFIQFSILSQVEKIVEL